MTSSLSSPSKDRYGQRTLQSVHRLRQCKAFVSLNVLSHVLVLSAMSLHTAIMRFLHAASLLLRSMQHVAEKGNSIMPAHPCHMSKHTQELCGLELKAGVRHVGLHSKLCVVCSHSSPCSHWPRTARRQHAGQLACLQPAQMAAHDAR